MGRGSVCASLLVRERLNLSGAVKGFVDGLSSHFETVSSSITSFFFLKKKKLLNELV